MNRAWLIAGILLASAALARAENPLAAMSDQLRRSAAGVTAGVASTGERTQRQLVRLARDLQHGWHALTESDQVRLARELWALRHHIRVLDYLQSAEAWERLGLRREQIVALRAGLRIAEAQYRNRG
jgi:hypothetical protein